MLITLFALLLLPLHASASSECLPLPTDGRGLRLDFIARGVRATGSSLEGGTLPSGVTHGHVDLSGPTGGGTLQGVSVDGFLSLLQLPPSAEGETHAQGTIVVSPAALMDMLRYFSANACIESIAFSLGKFGSGLYGNVYVYFKRSNVGPRGYRLYFTLPR